MTTSLSAAELELALGRLRASLSDLKLRYPGGPAGRQPVHTIYGGAQLFSSDTAAKLGRIAARTFAEYAPDAGVLTDVLGVPAGIAAAVHARIAAKLANEPVEDLRIDFEDGYGYRSDEEEDGHAIAAAEQVAAALTSGTLPPFCGIRIKPFSAEAHARGIRTLDLFLTTLTRAAGGRLPENFVVTLPKVESPAQAAAIADVFDEIEPKLGIAAGSLKLEIMVETARSIIAPDGRFALPAIVAAARGRCVAAHFGAYDYTAELGITAEYQDMFHQACDMARNVMQVSLAGTGVRLSDGANNVIPSGPHRGTELTDEQRAENRAAVHRAWRVHYDNCRRSLANGFYQSWDLHPAHLPMRYAAVYAFFLEGLDDASLRLRPFMDRAAQATLVGDVFDDAATGQGLLNYFLRAVDCRAITEEEAARGSGLTLDELRSGSFAAILERRA